MGWGGWRRGSTNVPDWDSPVKVRTSTRGGAVSVYVLSGRLRPGCHVPAGQYTSRVWGGQTGHLDRKPC